MPKTQLSCALEDRTRELLIRNSVCSREVTGGGLNVSCRFVFFSWSRTLGIDDLDFGSGKHIHKLFIDVNTYNFWDCGGSSVRRGLALEG